MPQQSTLYRDTMTSASTPIPIHLGAFLKMLRDRHAIAQSEVLKRLPGWQQSAYSKVEKDTRAPTFDQLVPIYRALASAGVQLTLQDRQQFLLLARRKIESMRTRHERKSDAAWEELREALTQVDHLPHMLQRPSLLPHLSRQRKSLLLESRHLIGREQWIASTVERIQGVPPTKLLILQGPVGIGKSSELHRVANHVLQQAPGTIIVRCDLPPVEQEQVGPEIGLELLLEEILEAASEVLLALPTTSLQARIKYVLNVLSAAERPVLILLDNAEQLLGEQGALAAVWQQFLAKFLHVGQDASLMLATREWPGAFMAESQLVYHTVIPPLSTEEGCQLLYRLGLNETSQEMLASLVETIGGIPQCLEWIAKLVQELHLRDGWSAFEEEDQVQAQRVKELLEDTSLFGGPVAKRLQPLLKRILGRLSSEGIRALHDLAFAPVPLAGPALKALYADPDPLKELRDASLLVAYAKRVQLLPMVAAQVRRSLSNEAQTESEERLIQALMRWVDEGIVSLREQGMVVTALATLLLRRHHLLAAAELILYHGWLTCQGGQILWLAHLLQRELDARPWPSSPDRETEIESGRILLHYYLSSYLGVSIDARERAEDYELIRAYVESGQVAVEPLMEVHLADQVMLYHLNEDRFEEAQQILDACFLRLQALSSKDDELHATLLSKRAILLNRRGSYALAQGDVQAATTFREQAISAYQQCLHLFERAEEAFQEGALRKSTIRKKQASSLNNLAYLLNITGRYKEALDVVNSCLVLKEQGYAERDSLAAAIGEKSQILAALGRFQESLQLDEQARTLVGRLAEAGDSMSQEEQWIYQVNQGRLAFLLGRLDEAERLLREAEPHIHARRKSYKMLAQTTLAEINRWREAAQAQGGNTQPDWRWVERYRQLSAYDAYWWWAYAGPLSDEEQAQWKELFQPPVPENVKETLRGILAASRERELASALAEGREPHLIYPAIEIDLVRERIADFLALDAEVGKEEPNAIVRSLYHGAIEDEVCFLRMIEATYQQDDARFFALSRQLHPLPKGDEMDFALLRLRQVVQQGLGRADTVEISRRVIDVLGDRCGITLHFESAAEALPAARPPLSGANAPSPRLISAQAAKRFFESVLHKSGFAGWRVVLDPNANGPRVESGLRQLFLQDSPFTLADIEEYLSHELLGHVARSVAGERSLLGLLGIGTKGYMPTEEGLADYHERHVAALHGQPFDDSGSWLGTLAVGLASGAYGRPQTFSTLFSFFAPFLLLYRLLWRDDEDRPTAEQRAHRNALIRCLRTFRGVTNLEQAGVCFTKDVVYLRGTLAIEQAVAADEAVLDRLAVGKVSLDLLPLLEELGIETPAEVTALRTQVYDPGLDARILSCEQEK